MSRPKPYSWTCIARIPGGRTGPLAATAQERWEAEGRGDISSAFKGMAPGRLYLEINMHCLVGSRRNNLANYARPAPNATNIFHPREVETVR